MNLRCSRKDNMKGFCPDFWKKVPSILIHYICKFLEMEEIARMSQVCKELNKKINGNELLWKDLCSSEFPSIFSRKYVVDGI